VKTLEKTSTFQLNTTRARIESLRRLSGSAPITQRGLLQEAFGELTESLEELSVAEEELHLQNEQLAASREILESERLRYQHLFDFAPDGYLVTDPLGVILEANVAASVLFNMPQRQVVNKPLAAFIHRDARRAFRTELSAFQNIQYIMEWDCVIQPRLAAPFDVAFTVSTVRDSQGSVSTLRWMLRDISERKRAEARILALNADLEERVRERTQELEEAYQREHRIAEVLQRAVLHKPVQTPRDAITVMPFYEPALDEALVGGDFYDAFTFGGSTNSTSALHDGEKVALIVGDVSGKGLAAAACTASVKYALRSILRREPSTSDAIARLNEFACDARRYGDWEDDVFLALSVVVFDKATGNAEFMTAGMDPIILLQPGKPAQEMATNCLVLGVEYGATYTTQAGHLLSGDTIAIVTDGITEARHSGLYFGVSGVIDQLRKGADLDLHDRGQIVIESARAFGSGTFNDDVCMLLAEILLLEPSS